MKKYIILSILLLSALVLAQEKVVSTIPNWPDVTNKPTTISGYGITDAASLPINISDVTNLQTGLDGKASTSHAHAPSDITGTAVITTDSRLSDARTPTFHSHAPADITGTAVITTDSRLSDARTPTAHNQDASTINAGTLDGDRLPAVSTTKKGAVPLTGTPSGKYLKDDGTWATIAGGGDVVAPATNSADYLPQWNGANSKTLKDGLAVPAGGLAGLTALNLKAPIDAPTFTGIPAAPTAAAGTNTTQLATTAFTTAINNNARYTTVYSGAGSHIAAKVAGNYVFPREGGVMAVGGTGTLYPQQVFYLTGADFPTINGITTKLRIKGSVFCNDVAPFTGTFTFGLHPITRPGTSGGAGVCIYTIGTVVSGSNGAVVTNAAADSSNNAIGSDFAIPADGWYALVCVTSATMATSAHTHITCELQMRNN